ncbi:MAG: hypothetical protein QOD63_1943 [Actinomycetota bacterium]|nr:hypothetical protein [Actinomycetota bacterium]
MGRLRLVKRWQVVAAGVAAVVVAGAIVAAVTNETSGDATLAVGEPARDSVAAPAPAPLAFPSPSGAGGNASIAIGDESGQKQVDIGPVPPSTVPGAVVPGALKIVRTG